MSRLDAIRAAAQRQAAPAPRVPIAKPARKLPGDDVGRIRWRGQGRDEAAAEASKMPWWPRRKSDAPSPPSNGWWCWALTPAASTGRLEIAASLPAGQRLSTVSAYPGDTPADAAARAAGKRWWPDRLGDAPTLMGKRWAWITRSP